MMAYTPELASMPILARRAPWLALMGLFLSALLRRASVHRGDADVFPGNHRVNKIALPAFAAIILWFVLQRLPDCVAVEGTAYISHLAGLARRGAGVF